MKISILTIAYNEAQHIIPCINNWKKFVDSGEIEKHLVLVSSKPWFGSPVEDDGTYDIAKNMGVDVILRYWDSEKEQREWGLSYLYDSDYVIIVDPDEYYTYEDQLKILKRLNDPYDYQNRTNQKIPCFCCENIITYWKTSDYIFLPADTHHPIIAVDPKQVRFSDKRACRMKNNGDGYVTSVEPLKITTHHFSWVKTNEKVYEKIHSYSHSDDFDVDSWYNNIWLNWKPESDIMIRPYGIEKSYGKLQPAPKEIKDLFN